MKKNNIPSFHAARLYDLAPLSFKEHGFATVLFDMDNTLVPYGTPAPTEECRAYIQELLALGLRVAIASNGASHRVLSFGKSLGIPVYTLLWKPFPFRLRKLMKEQGYDPKATILVGDQIQTDVRAGNAAGIATLLLEPLEPHEPIWTRFNRLFDKGKRERMRQEGLLRPWEEER